MVGSPGKQDRSYSSSALVVLVKVEILYDADGTKSDIIEGHRVSIQLFSGTSTGLVVVYDDNDHEVESYHYSTVYRIHRIK